MNKKIIAVIVVLIIVIIGVVVILYNNRDEKTETSNSVNSYITEAINVADENEIGVPADSMEFNRSPENVTIDILSNTISNSSVEILITDNNVDQYGWGIEFSVQEKVNDAWKDLSYISDNLSWIDIAYELNADNQLTQKLDIEKYYGKLNSGIYRIVKPVYDNEYIDIYSNEFEIK